MRFACRVPAALVSAVLVATPLRGQLRPSIAIDGRAMTTRLEATGAGAGVFTGTAIGGGGVLGLGRVALEVSYLQGTLSADSGGAADRDIVEGTLQIATRATPSVTLGIGPRARAWVTPAGTQRWMRWEVTARAEPLLVGDRVRAWIAGWYALSASTGIADGSARGAEAGITVRPSPRVFMQLLYRADRLTTSAGGAENLEMIGLSIGYGGR